MKMERAQLHAALQLSTKGLSMRVRLPWTVQTGLAAAEYHQVAHVDAV